MFLLIKIYFTGATLYQSRYKDVGKQTLNIKGYKGINMDNKLTGLAVGVKAFAEISQVAKSLDNLNRRLILFLCSQEAHNILSLKRKIGIGYKSVYEHVKNLQKSGLVETSEKINANGKNILVKTKIDKNIDKILKINEEILQKDNLLNEIKDPKRKTLIKKELEK